MTLAAWFRTMERMRSGEGQWMMSLQKLDNGSVEQIVLVTSDHVSRALDIDEVEVWQHFA